MLIISVQAQLSFNEIVEGLRKTSKDTSVEDKLRSSIQRAQVTSILVALAMAGTAVLDLVSYDSYEFVAYPSMSEFWIVFRVVYVGFCASCVVSLSFPVSNTKRHTANRFWSQLFSSTTIQFLSRCKKRAGLSCPRAARLHPRLRLNRRLSQMCNPHFAYSDRSSRQLGPQV